MSFSDVTLIIESVSGISVREPRNASGLTQNRGYIGLRSLVLRRIRWKLCQMYCCLKCMRLSNINHPVKWGVAGMLDPRNYRSWCSRRLRRWWFLTGGECTKHGVTCGSYSPIPDANENAGLLTHTVPSRWKTSNQFCFSIAHPGPWKTENMTGLYWRDRWQATPDQEQEKNCTAWDNFLSRITIGSSGFTSCPSC
jgi:hypothetical protein